MRKWIDTPPPPPILAATKTEEAPSFFSVGPSAPDGAGRRRNNLTQGSLFQSLPNHILVTKGWKQRAFKI